MSGPATIHVFVKLRAGLWVAATPRSGTDQLRTMLGEVYPGIGAAGSVLATTLQNGNPVIHPAVTLSNAALIERTGGDFNFYEDGITPAVGRLMQAVDSERMAIAAALGQTIASDPAIGVMQGYMIEENYDTGYSTAPGSAASGPKANSTIATSPRTSATPWCCSPSWLGRLAYPPP